MHLPAFVPRALTPALAIATLQATGLPRHVRAQEEPVRRDLIIEVVNDNFHDATLYAVRGGLRLRLGFVSGFARDTFRFRWPEGDLQIEIKLLSVGSYYTQLMDVQEGEDLQLLILPSLHTLRPGTVF